jgi:hypothetical protein
MYRQEYRQLSEGDIILPHFWSKPIKITKILIHDGADIKDEIILLEGTKKLSQNFNIQVKAKFIEKKPYSSESRQVRHKCWVLGRKDFKPPINKFYIEPMR